MSRSRVSGQQRLAALRLVGDRIDAGRDRELWDLMHPAMGLVLPVLARLLMTRPSDDWHKLRKPLCALVVLETPAW